MKEKSVSFDGTSIFYYEEGSGFPLVFIHGFCEDYTVWNEFAIPFAKNYKVLLVDSPGFGKSSLPKTKMEISDYADVVKKILDEENIRECAMIGHSMGGYATLNFASRFSNLLKGFALFHSSAFEDDDVKKEDRVRVAEFVRKNGAAPFVNELYNKLFGAKYFSSHQIKIDAIKKYFASVSSVEGIAQASFAMGKRKDTTEVLKQTNVPVLFIIGKEDKTVLPEKALQQSHMPDRSVICLLDDVGHMGMYEAREKPQENLREWLDMCLRE